MLFILFDMVMELFWSLKQKPLTNATHTHLLVHNISILHIECYNNWLWASVIDTIYEQ